MKLTKRNRVYSIIEARQFQLPPPNHKLTRGKIMTRKIIAPSDLQEESVHHSKSCGRFKIKTYFRGSKIEVEFLKTGYKTTTQNWNIRRGNIKDFLIPFVCGVGYVGVGCHATIINGKQTVAYKTWADMLRRCYSNNALIRNPTYTGCTVCQEWHDFQVFSKWFVENRIDGFKIDKDLLVKGNKVYSPETCVFVSHQLNTLLMGYRSIGKTLPRGVSPNGIGYRSRLRENGKTICKTFATIDAASKWYRHKKAKEIVRQALLPTTPRVLFESLLTRAEEML